MPKLINKLLFVSEIHRHWFPIKELRTCAQRRSLHFPLWFFRLVSWVPSIPGLLEIFPPLFLTPCPGPVYFSSPLLNLQRYSPVCWAGKHPAPHLLPFNHIFSEGGSSSGIWFWNQGIPPSASNCLSTTDFLVGKLGTSENRMRSLRPTAMLNYNSLYLHNVLKYIVSYKALT